MGIAKPIEDYALIGNTRSAALVGRDGSIDWFCTPRFDSPACFAALLGDVDDGHWKIHPREPVRSVRRRYRKNSLVVETEFDTDTGSVRLIDCMPIWPDHRSEQRNDIVRVVEGIRGTVPMHMDWIVRFDYGSIVPWVRRAHGGLIATGGSDSLILYTPIATHGKDMTTVADFEIVAGQRLSLVLSHFPSHRTPPLPIDPLVALAVTTRQWQDWSDRCCIDSPHADAVRRSLITLKALTYSPSGGIVAAPTTSLPESIGGPRNWDYRFCWLRDATFTLQALWECGYQAEAFAWREWLLRAVAGRPKDLRTLYGVCGERRLSESEVGWLGGYRNSRPVRVGNEAHTQLQLDVFGEVMNTLHLSRRQGMDHSERAWQVQLKLLEFLESNWQQPDNGIWEMRAERKQFTHSNVMCWVAFDRAVHSAEQFQLDGPVQRWRALRDRIKEDILAQAFDRNRNTFVQTYGGDRLDASLLLLPLVGFVPAKDPRMQGTVAAIERELLQNGLVRRYLTDGHDGLSGGEGVFLPCSFWLVDNYALQGRIDDAQKLLQRLLNLQNDVGLLPEECDPETGCFLGNFPQAFTHVGLINSVRHLALASQGGSHMREDNDSPPRQTS